MATTLARAENNDPTYNNIELLYYDIAMETFTLSHFNRWISLAERTEMKS